MDIDNYYEKDRAEMDAIKTFIESIESQPSELILTSSGKTVGAILTAEQYEWFLDQLDEQQNTDFINERLRDLAGFQSLTEFKADLRC